MLSPQDTAVAFMIEHGTGPDPVALRDALAALVRAERAAVREACAAVLVTSRRAATFAPDPVDPDGWQDDLWQWYCLLDQSWHSTREEALVAALRALPID